MLTDVILLVGIVVGDPFLLHGWSQFGTTAAAHAAATVHAALGTSLAKAALRTILTEATLRAASGTAILSLRTGCTGLTIGGTAVLTLWVRRTTILSLRIGRTAILSLGVCGTAVLALGIGRATILSLRTGCTSLTIGRTAILSLRTSTTLCTGRYLPSRHGRTDHVGSKADRLLHNLLTGTGNNLTDGRLLGCFFLRLFLHGGLRLCLGSSISLRGSLRLGGGLCSRLLFLLGGFRLLLRGSFCLGGRLLFCLGSCLCLSSRLGFRLHCFGLGGICFRLFRLGRFSLRSSICLRSSAGLAGSFILSTCCFHSSLLIFVQHGERLGVRRQYLLLLLTALLRCAFFFFSVKAGLHLLQRLHQRIGALTHLVCLFQHLGCACRQFFGSFLLVHSRHSTLAPPQ